MHSGHAHFKRKLIAISMKGAKFYMLIKNGFFFCLLNTTQPALMGFTTLLGNDAFAL